MRRIFLTALVLASAAVCGAATGKAAVLAPLTVNEEVHGDVIALAGDITVGPEARVHGHAIAIFGTVVVNPTARVDGRIIAVRSLASLALDPETEAAGPRLEVAVKLLTSGGWLLVTTVLAFLFPARVRGVVATIPSLWTKVLVLGLMGALTLFAALVAVLGLGPGLGVPLAVGLLLVFFVGKALGLATIGGWLGLWITGRWFHRSPPMTAAVFLGVAMMLLVRGVPVVGGALWSIVSIVALGAGAFTLALSPQNGALEVTVPPTRPARHP